MTTEAWINDAADGIGAFKIWLTRLNQTGTAANRSSTDRNGSSAAVRSNLLADQANPNHAFLVGTIPHGKSRLERAQKLGVNVYGKPSLQDAYLQVKRNQQMLDKSKKTPIKDPKKYDPNDRFTSTYDLGFSNRIGKLLNTGKVQTPKNEK